MITQLGQFQFESDDVAYDALERVRAWRHPEVPIVGDTPILQFAGREAPTITFSGTQWTYVGNADSVQSLADLGDAGEPLPLTADTGRFYGFWVIKSLREREAFFRPGQERGIQSGWTLELAFYGDKKERVA